jgi:hypothetical protein
MTRARRRKTPLRQLRFDDELPPEGKRPPIPVPPIAIHYASTPDGWLGDEALKRIVEMPSPPQLEIRIVVVRDDSKQVGRPSRSDDIRAAYDGLAEEERRKFKSKAALFGHLRDKIAGPNGSHRGLGHEAMNDALAGRLDGGESR